MVKKKKYRNKQKRAYSKYELNRHKKIQVRRLKNDDIYSNSIFLG